MRNDGEPVNLINTVKMLTFRKAELNSFFKLCDLTFSVYKITSDISKLRHAVTSLDYQTLDLIDSPHQSSKYDKDPWNIHGILEKSAEETLLGAADQ